MFYFGAQKNRHYFTLARPDYKDKGGKSWDVEIEDMLPQGLVASFVDLYPDAEEESFRRRGVTKYVISGKPVVKEGETYDYKMMLVDYAREHATADDLTALIKLLRRARKCMGMGKG